MQRPQGAGEWVSMRQSLGRDALGLVPPQASWPQRPCQPPWLQLTSGWGRGVSLALGEELAFRSGRGGRPARGQHRSRVGGGVLHQLSPPRLPATEEIPSRHPPLWVKSTRLMASHLPGSPAVIFLTGITTLYRWGNRGPEREGERMV